MKTLLFILSFAGMAHVAMAQQTATNFTVADCSGNSFSLFDELDSGKVVIISWVMPCGTCVGPSKAAYNLSQSYAASHPGKVVFLLVDDYGNTSCGGLQNWATTNSIGPNLRTFVNPAISMLDYGSNGMPKTVILGGSGHTVFFNANNAAAGNQVALQNAMDQALTINATAPVQEEIQISISPNPAKAALNVSYVSDGTGQTSIELFSSAGKSFLLLSEVSVAGVNEKKIDVAHLPAGNYIVRVTSGKATKSSAVTISH